MWKIKCFNPCFNGCPSSIHADYPIPLTLSPVSILVLMDVLLQLELGSFKDDAKPIVSILVLMDVLLQFGVDRADTRVIGVSILVLMDVLLQY